jgi:putative membrane protein
MQGHRRGGILIAILLLVLIGLGIWWLVRSKSNKRESHPDDRAREILAERFARGEITHEEYRERRRQLE